MWNFILALETLKAKDVGMTHEYSKEVTVETAQSKVSMTLKA